MYFIDNEKDLIGKKIAFTHMATYAEAITIVTEDKGIFVCDKDEEEIMVYMEHQAKPYILGQSYIRKELNKLGIITDEDIQEYERKQEEDRRIYLENEKKRQAENEYNFYLRLKKKYEGE